MVPGDRVDGLALVRSKVTQLNQFSPLSPLQRDHSFGNFHLPGSHLLATLNPIEIRALQSPAGNSGDGDSE